MWQGMVTETAILCNVTPISPPVPCQPSWSSGHSMVIQRYAQILMSSLDNIPQQGDTISPIHVS